MKPYPSPGKIASSVNDCGSNVQWDILDWEETLPANTDVTFEVRASNNVFAAGDATPAWTDVGGTPPVTSGFPPGRYQQWRATLITSDPYRTPILHSVTVTYTALATELAGLSVIGREGYIEILWRTEAEIDNEKWVIVRSLNEKSGYEQIAQLPPKEPLSNYTYIDSTVYLNTTYYYKLGDMDTHGNVIWYDPLKAKARGIKYSFFLQRPTPSPFKDYVKIHYGIAGWSWEQPRHVTLEIYDSSGRIVKVLVDRHQSPCCYTIYWDGKDEHGNQVSSGVYFGRLKVDNKLLTCELIRIE